MLDNFFLKRLTKLPSHADQIRETCRKLITTDGRMDMKGLAYRTNMSLQTLERNFTAGFRKYMVLYINITPHKYG